LRGGPGIERLVRYCARPPFALERLQALDSIPARASPESRLLYRFPKPDVDGRTELLLTPLELLEALSKFAPSIRSWVRNDEFAAQPARLGRRGHERGRRAQGS
jgi:hypothetical protein